MSYGLSRPDLDAVAAVFQGRYDELWSLTYAELIALDWSGEDGHRDLALSGGLVACIEANEIDHGDGMLEVGICAYLVHPTFGQRIADGPAFVVHADGRREPDDGDWRRADGAPLVARPT